MKLAPLLAALRLAAPALGKDDKVMLPALSHFCFDDDNFLAFNDQVAVIVGLKTGLTLGLHGETLLGVLGAQRGEDVEIKVKGRTATLSGSGKVELPILEKNEFVFQLPAEEPVLSIPLGPDVRRALELCLISAGEDSLQPHFNGVTIRIGKQGTVLFSTDNVTASRVRPPSAKLPSRKEAGVVLPKEAAELVLKLSPAEGKPTMHIGERVVVVDFGGEPDVTLVAKLLGAPSSRLDDVFRDHAEKAAGFPVPAGLDAEIEKAKVLTSRDPLKECTLSVAKGTLVVEAQGALGRMSTALKIESKTAEGEVTVPPENVARMLPHTKLLHINAGRSLVLQSEGFDHIVAAVPKAAPATPVELPPPPPRPKRGIEDDDIPY